MFRVPLWTGALSALFFVVTGIQFWVTKYLVDVIGVEQGPVCGAGCTSPSSLCHSVLSTHPLFQHVERDARHPPPSVILYCQHPPSLNPCRTTPGVSVSSYPSHHPSHLIRSLLHIGVSSMAIVHFALVHSFTCLPVLLR